MNEVLLGLRVLIVEDEYYLATEAQRVLEAAGAIVYGPCRNSSDALALLANATPHVAILNVNLGEGPSFDLALALKAQSIPFLFLTGYEQNVIPAEFAGIQRLEKPLSKDGLIKAVLCASYPGS